MSGNRDEFVYGTFPEGFEWGTATASYQIEGGVYEDGRGQSIWDTFSKTPGKVKNGDTGDVACDSYHQYPKDTELLKQLGVQRCRFSIAWPRIMSDGTLATLNPAGIAYYNKVIDALLGAGIQPMVTLYHWDLPQDLQSRGGFINPDFADWFDDFARVCFREFGDRVKQWITFNEPICTVWLGYGNGAHAPGVKDPSKSTFQAAHNLIRAHARAYRTYCAEFKPTQKGVCGITINNDWEAPKDESNPADVAASEKVLQCKLGWYANPIFGDGDYPQVLKDQMVDVTKALKLPKNPLPEFTEEEKKLNKGSSDFFGLNHYTTRLISPSDGPIEPSSEAGMFQVTEEVDPAWSRGQSSWLFVVPWGIRRLLAWVSKTYNNPPIYVTENGISDGSGDLKDTARVNYYKSYINEVLKAINEDKVDVRGYCAWSLLDNYEWAEGYSEKFGLTRVDFDDPKRTRTPKESFSYYAQIVKDNGFPKK
jgi:lactase-phlorizin hydrolase